VLLRRKFGEQAVRDPASEQLGTFQTGSRVRTEKGYTVLTSIQTKNSAEIWHIPCDHLTAETVFEKDGLITWSEC